MTQTPRFPASTPAEDAASASDRNSIRTVRAIVNPASGSVGKGAEAELERILKAHGLDAEVVVVTEGSLNDDLRSAVDAKPDLLIVLAGDGTARAAAQLCGPDGPLMMPLPGGTMNMLPRALYGERAWAQALQDTLETGEARTISGGEVGGDAFYVAAILGAPALWATAREALRKGRLRLAWLRSLRAIRRAFAGRLRFSLDDRPRVKAEALSLMCPLVSRGLNTDDALEACGIDPRHVGEGVRLGVRTLLTDILGDWRLDPAVTATTCKAGTAWAHGRIPAILDGEPRRLESEVAIRFVPRAFRTLAPPKPEAEAQAAEGASAGS